jgi:hypothetical protein
MIEILVKNTKNNNRGRESLPSEQYNPYYFRFFEMIIDLTQILDP